MFTAKKKTLCMELDYSRRILPLYAYTEAEIGNNLVPGIYIIKSSTTPLYEVLGLFSRLRISRVSVSVFKEDPPYLPLGLRAKDTLDLAKMEYVIDKMH